MGSARFPGKMLAKLGDRPVLEWVLRRVARARLPAETILATTDEQRDDPLAELAEELQVPVFRGSESDVLGRFAAAARTFAADAVVRVCADNPFIDPHEIDRLIDFYWKQPSDYAFNHLDRCGSGYADGFGAEVISNDVLQQIAVRAVDTRHREHVTLFLWDNVSDFRLGAVPAPRELAHPRLRFDIDRPEDLADLQAVVDGGVTIATGAAEIVRIKQRMAAAEAGGSLGSEIDSYLRRLFPLCRSVTGEPNRETLRILQEVVPLSIHEVPSGTAVYDWTVPDEWTIRDAWIADETGQRIVDFKANNLHVVSYSEPVNARMMWSELAPHIHRHADLPDAIPYRTSYYKRSWGFCITHSQFERLAATTGPLTVVVDSDLKPGAMSYGELLLPGRSSKELLLSCYICHPSMANDNLSGVLLTAFLARHIAGLQDRKWSYRIVFVPETIGAIAYCARNEQAMKAIDMALVITTVGGSGRFGYKQSWQADHPLNGLVEGILRETEHEFDTYPFDIHGSDERQYSSQRFRINAATICRDRYYEYPYYHTSLDDLSYVTGAQIADTYRLYVRLIAAIEDLRIYRNRLAECEVMLSRHDLYPTVGGALQPPRGGMTETDIILWLLFLCDGHMPLQNIAQRLGIELEPLQQQIDKLLGTGVLEEV